MCWVVRVDVAFLKRSTPRHAVFALLPSSSNRQLHSACFETFKNSQLSRTLKKTIRNARAIPLSFPGSNQRHYLFPLNNVAAVRILMADDITEIRDDKRKTDFLFVGSIEKKGRCYRRKIVFWYGSHLPAVFPANKKAEEPTRSLSSIHEK